MTKVTANTFSKQLTSLVKSQTSVKTKAHALIVFAIGHAHEHGDTIYLNMLKNKLNKAYLASFRRYLVAVTAIDYNSPVTSWLSMHKGDYIMNPDFKGKKKQLFFRDKDKKPVKLKHANELLALPTFLDIDPDKMKNPYADSNVFSAVNRIVKAMDKDGSEVSKKVRKAVTKFNTDLAKLMPDANTPTDTKGGTRGSTRVSL